MREQQASRTLLKSPPELWAECSDAQSLAKHLGEFGEIRIKKLEPEHTVAWEGERASGTVKLEPSGWGTRVTLTYSAPDANGVPPEAKLEPEPQQEPEPEHEPEPEPNPEPQIDRSPNREPGPVPSEPAANAALTSEQPPAGQPRGRLLERVLRFLAPERGTTGSVAAKRSAPEPPRSKPEPPPPEPPAPEPAAPQPAASDAPAPQLAAADAPAPQPAGATETSDALAAALDSLGQAHHRPFSRA